MNAKLTKAPILHCLCIPLHEHFIAFYIHSEAKSICSRGKIYSQSLTENTVYIFSPWETNSLCSPEHKRQHRSTRCRCCKIAKVHEENLPRAAMVPGRFLVWFISCAHSTALLGVCPCKCQDSVLQGSTLNSDSVNRNKAFLPLHVFCKGFLWAWSMWSCKKSTKKEKNPPHICTILCQILYKWDVFAYLVLVVTKEPLSPVLYPLQQHTFA